MLLLIPIPFTDGDPSASLYTKKTYALHLILEFCLSSSYSHCDPIPSVASLPGIPDEYSTY